MQRYIAGMTRYLRISFALILSAALALTAQTMAHSRGAAMAEGQMVLCTGTGAVTVYFDAEGNPTSAPHICPDCALSLFDAVSHPAEDCVPAAAVTSAWFASHALAIVPDHALAPRARGPPLTV